MKYVVLPYSADNYSYLLVCEKSGAAAIIDPGDAAPVVAVIENENISLQAIFCTHHHADHVGGVPALKEQFPELKVVCHESDIHRIAGATDGVEDGGAVSVGESCGRVLHTPGHTAGSICYLFDDCIFTGDTLFGAGCGRLFEGTPQQMYASLLRLDRSCKASTEVCFGHEYTRTNLNFALQIDPENEPVAARLQNIPRKDGHDCSTPSTMGEERRTNPFLYCLQADQEEGIRCARRRRIAARFDGEVETEEERMALFASIRKLRDGF